MKCVILPKITTTRYSSAGGLLMNCSRVRTAIVKTNKSSMSGNCFQSNKLLKAIVIESVDSTELTDFAGSFAYCCQSLTKFVFPKTLKTLGNGCFDMQGQESSMCDVYSDLKVLNLPETLLSIGSNCFRNLAIERLTIPQNITSLGASSFDGCYRLKEIIWLCRYTFLGGQYKFEKMPLERIVFPSDITSIPTIGIKYKRNLKDITLPSELITLNGLDRCGVEKLIIPEKVTTINVDFPLLKNVILTGVAVTSLSLVISNLENIWVDDSILEDMKTKFPLYAPYFKPISQMPEDL
jgi:hypothetical protein